MELVALVCFGVIISRLATISCQFLYGYFIPAICAGLGLATTYSIINSHDGYITVKSELGVGTTFYIYLHASRKPIPKKQEEGAVQSALRGRGRILIMDDEEMIRLLLNRILTGAGYNVELAKDGEEAIKHYTEARESGKPFDTVIFWT